MIGVRAGGTGRAAATPPPSSGNVARERKLKEKCPSPPKKREMKQRLSFPIKRQANCAHASFCRMKVCGVNQVSSTRDPIG